MQVCKERHLISKSHYAFPSKSDPTKKPYKVYAFREGEPTMCTCYPFLTGRAREAKKLGVTVDKIDWTCSHIKRLMAKTCDWKQETEADYQWSQKCPKCGDELIDDDKITLPDDREGQIDDLRALLRELEEAEKDANVDANDSASQLLDLMKGSS